MEDIEFSPDMVKLLKKFEKGSDIELTTAWGSYYERSVKLKMATGKIVPVPSALTQFNRKSPGNALADNRTLKDSIGFSATATEVKVGSPLFYAKMLHDGGKIAARKAQKLAIPFGYRWRQETNIRGSVRAVLEKYEHYFTKGAIMIEGKCAFIRKDFVKIPPRPFLHMNEENFRRLKLIYQNWIELNSFRGGDS
jgi:phage gpG-like protein